MSGSSDYTTTPNLGLFKPNYDMDDGQWGFHLNTNADKLDAALGSSANGPFLPLTGSMPMTGPLTIGTGTGTPTLILNGAAGAGKGVGWQSTGTMRWRLETTAGEDLALNGYDASGAWLGQAIQFAHDASSIVTSFPIVANASQAIPTQGVVGIQAIAKNTGSNIGNGYQFSYYSSAFANGFDVGFTRLAAFDPAPYVAGQTPIYQADWTLVCSPNDTTHNWACIVAEWDVVNRGADMGWKRDRGSANPTGGLLMVAEATAVLGGESGEGKNATFAYSVSHSGENNSTGFPAKFYNGYLIEPDSIVGGTGRGIYMTGDITSTASQRPYGPAQFEGTWLHGIDHTLATYIDGHAEILAPGQAVAWLVGPTTAPTAAASITGSGSGTNASLTLTPAGTGTIALAGNSSVAGGLTVGNGVAVSAGLSTFSADALFQSSSFNAVRISGLVSAYRLMSFETSGVVRFRMGLDPTFGEPGGNAGSPFVIAGYSDAGGGLGTYLSIARNNGALSLTNSIGVWGATPPAAKPVMSGAKGGNTALASVIALLAAYGLGIDSTTA